MQALGRVSYSWYLWHWPPLVLVPVTLDTPLTIPLGLTIAAATLALSFASYRWIEQPPRHAPLLIRRTGLALATGAALTAIPAITALTLAIDADLRAVPAAASAAFTEMSETDPTAVPTASRPVNLDLSKRALQRDSPRLIANGCHAVYEATRPVPGCVFGDTASSRRIVLFGDSHAAQWFGPLEVAAGRAGYALVARTKTGCPAADVSVLAKKRPYHQCDAWRARVLAELSADPEDVVVVSSGNGRSLPDVAGPGGRRSLPEAATADAWYAGLRRTLERLQRTGARVVLIRDTPAMGVDVRDCLSEKADASACSVPRKAALVEPPRDVAVAQALGVEVWDLTDEVCSPDICRAVVDDRVAWYDDDHLAAGFTATLVPEFSRLLTAEEPDMK